MLTAPAPSIRHMMTIGDTILLSSVIRYMPEIIGKRMLKGLDNPVLDTS